MNKKKFGKKLSRARGARGALMRSLLRSLILYGKITTTKTKAKFLLPGVNKLLVKVKANSLSDRREVLAALNDKVVTKSLFKLKPEKVSVLALGTRKGDNAPMVRVEFLGGRDKSQNLKTKVEPKKEIKIKK